LGFSGLTRISWGAKSFAPIGNPISISSFFLRRNLERGEARLAIAEEYLARAAYCKALADEAADIDMKLEFERLAQSWTNLANDEEIIVSQLKVSRRA
jgi:hypothetical protein